MIAAFLPPYAFRGVPAPYLWVFYKLLAANDEKKYFIIGEEYLFDYSTKEGAARWELLESSQERLGYTIPTNDEISKHDLHFLSGQLFDDLLEGNNHNPSATFEKLLTESVPALVSELEEILKKTTEMIEAVITWCNCPSLTSAANSLGIPVIHLELGPLRDPDYQSTMYVDFSGVNGNTEAKTRYESLLEPIETSLSPGKFLDYFLEKQPEQISPADVEQNYKIGVAFQVEDDSNLIAFGNRFDNRGLLSYAQLHSPINEVLVRAHPGSLFQVKPNSFSVDNSETSIEFIQRCEKIVTINSSVGLEAILQSKIVSILGECSYKFIIEAGSIDERNNRLAFYLFAYLVPAKLAFDFDYLRFRISCKKETEIVRYHLSQYSPNHHIPEHKETLKEMIETEVHARHIDTLNRTIDERSKVIDEYAQIIDERSKVIDEYARVIDEHTKVIDEHSRAIDEHTKVIEQLNGELHNLNGAIELHEAELRSTRQNLVAAEHSSSQLSSVLREENSNLDLKLQGALNDLKAVEQDLRAAERLLFISQAHVDGLLSSSSWKITSPLRNVRSQLFRVSQLKKALSIALLHFGSPMVIGKKALTIYRREGLMGVRARVRNLLESSSAPISTAVVTSDRNGSRELNRHTSSVDIIVCVHNALDDVKNCLESISAYTLPPFTLIIVDDGSSKETQDYLSEYAEKQGAVIHRNETAGGYTKAANCGLKLSNAEFSVLLNSDTIVSPYWLERLLACAVSDERIGIVGPLSNTASWQSVPEIFDAKGDWTDNPIPTGLSIQQYADEIARESLRIYPRVGFINGFCFLIKRELTRQIGIFDELIFGRGYGEENDFCLRAAKAGWQLAIADDAYVFHAQSKSYSHERRMELSKAAGVNLANKHGQEIIDQQLNITANHPALEYIRQRTNLIEEKLAIRKSLAAFQGKRLLFVLPARTAGGGGNIILLEAAKLISNGVDVQIVNLHSNKEIFEANHPYNQVPMHYIYSPEDIVEIAQHFDVVIGTLYLTIEWLLPLAKPDSAQTLAYYIQDFEPDFFPEGSTEYVRAWNSYTLIDQIKLVTKTTWNRDILKQRLGVECTVIGADFDDNEFRPDPICRKIGQSLIVTAMVRPATPRRSPDLTMRVLNRLKSTFGDAITIRTFGADQENPEYQKISGGFQHECLGELNAIEVSELLRKSDIFLDYSVFQAMGLTAMEAAASGAINVGPINGGLSEVIIENETGVLVDTRDEEICFIKTCEIIRDAQRRINIGKKSLGITQYYPEKAVLNLMNSLFKSDRAGLKR